MSALDQALIKIFQKQSGAAQSPTGLPAPHVRLNPTPTVAATDFDDVLVGSDLIAAAEAEAAALKASPLDAAAARRLAQPNSPPRSVPQQAPWAVPLEPVFEVPCFDWPEILDSLIAASSLDLIAFCDELARSSTTGASTLVISSCRRGEGRTTLALALARMLSQGGRKVALVDADYTNPRLAQRLGIVPQAGWEDVLAGDQPLPEALIESAADRATLLPLRGPNCERHSALAGDNPLATSLRALARHYEFVVIDTEPLESNTSGELAASISARAGIDAALVVRDTRLTTEHEVRTVGRRLTEAGIVQWNLVENFLRD